MGRSAGGGARIETRASAVMGAARVVRYSTRTGQGIGTAAALMAGMTGRVRWAEFPCAGG